MTPEQVEEHYPRKNKRSEAFVEPGPPRPSVNKRTNINN